MPISKRNRRGLIWLLLIGLVIVYCPRIFSTLNDSQGFSISYEKAIELEEEIVSAKKKESKKKYKKKESKYSVPSKSFNPNDYLLDDWLKLGLSKKQAEVIQKFTTRKIYSNKELEKIFVLPKELFNLIKDSTFYPQKNHTVMHYEKEVLIVDLNTADAVELESIPGIGSFFSAKIIEQREGLGGFISDNQLLDIWKFDTEKLRAIQPYIKISIDDIKQININTSSIDELKSHPYISYAVANSIVKMKEQRGDYFEVEEIKKSKLVDEELFEKIEPYLKIK